MINWISLKQNEQIKEIIERSKEVTCLLFKHSTRCHISTIVKYRLEEDWDFHADDLEPYYLDLIKYRSVSNAIADTFSIQHESPQVVLIKNGECIYDASHLDITVGELKEAPLKNTYKVI